MVNFLYRNHSKSHSISTLLKSGFTPSLKDFNNFLLFLFRNQRFNAIIHFVSQLNSNKIKCDSQTHTIFTKALLREHKYEAAADFLKTHIGKSKIYNKARIFDSIIQGLCIFAKEREKGLSLLRELLKMEDGIFPSSYTFCSLIYSFSSIGKLDRVVDVLELMSDEKLNYPFDNFVCSSVISGFVRIGKPELAVGFYENAVNSGSLKPNVVTCTALICAYCKLSRTHDVLDLVTWMRSNGLAFDVVFYSNWIYGYFGEGIIVEAFRKYREMVDMKMELDTISYTILIDGFSKDGNVEKAVGFLYKMRKNGVEPNLVTYTAIIMGFCKKGKLEEAFAIFRMIKDFGIEVDEFTYAILIDGVCKRGNFDSVLPLLNEMEEKGINPSIITYNTIINGLCKAGRMSEADDFSRGTVGDVITYTTLLHGYVKERSLSGILETKRRLEIAGVHMDNVLCNILIKALLSVGLFEDAFAAFKVIPKMDSVTYRTLIDGYCKAGRFYEALEIFNEFRKMSNSSAACYYSISRFLLFNGKKSLARVILSSFVKVHGMSDLRVNKIILYYLCLSDVKNALKFLEKMEDGKYRKWAIAIPFVILEKLVKDGRVLDAYELLVCADNNAPVMDVVDYSIIINALCKKGHVDEALDLCSVAKSKGIALNIVIYNSILNGLCRQGCLVEAFRLFDSLEKINVSPTEVTFGTLIDALTKEGNLHDARMLFERMFSKNLKSNIHIYNSLIHGYCKSNLLEEAFKLVEDLQGRSLKPDGFTVDALINGYCLRGDMEGALKLFLEFKGNGLLPDFLGFMFLIRGLCAKGRMEESRGVLREMLRTESVVHLLRRVDHGIDFGTDRGVDLESMESILTYLGEQGRIQEAIAVLDEEVGSRFFLSGRSFSAYNGPGGHDIKENTEFGLSKRPAVSFLDDLESKTFQWRGFDSYYALICCLCSKGKLSKANELARKLVDFR